MPESGCYGGTSEGRLNVYFAVLLNPDGKSHVSNNFDNNQKHVHGALAAHPKGLNTNCGPHQRGGDLWFFNLYIYVL